MAESVGDLEGFELGDAAAGFFPEGLEVGGVDLELALNLLDHQERVGDYPEAGVVVVERPLEAGEEAGVLGEVVGAVAEEFGELGEDLTGLVVDYGAEAGGAGVAAGSAVAVGGDPAGLGGVVGEEGSGLRHLVQSKRRRVAHPLPPRGVVAITFAKCFRISESRFWAAVKIPI